MPAHLPCPHCGAQPRTHKGYTIHTKDKFVVECSNNIDCDLWPYLGGYATAADALAAWNRGEAFPAEVQPATE